VRRRDLQPLGPRPHSYLGTVELSITIAFDVEIIWRISGHFPDWREFFLHRHNLLDMTLAVATAIIQIPLINNSPVYRWLTIFQLARFYRVILFVPRMRPLLVRRTYISIQRSPSRIKHS
jgi:hypothetical protein